MNIGNPIPIPLRIAEPALAPSISPAPERIAVPERETVTVRR